MKLILLLIFLVHSVTAPSQFVNGDFDGDGIKEKAYLKTILENGNEITELNFTKSGLKKWKVEKNCLIENIGNVNQRPGEEILISNLHYDQMNNPAQFQIISYDAGLLQFRVVASGEEPHNKKGNTTAEKIITKKDNQYYFNHAISATGDTLELIEG